MRYRSLFSWEKGTGYYIPFSENRSQSQALILKLKPFFESEKIKKIGHNLKYDIKVLNKGKTLTDIENLSP